MNDTQVHLTLASQFGSMLCPGINRVMRGWRRLVDMENVDERVKPELRQAIALGEAELAQRQDHGCEFHDTCEDVDRRERAEKRWLVDRYGYQYEEDEL